MNRSISIQHDDSRPDANLMQPERPSGPDLWPNIARGLALFWGGLALIGALTASRSGFDPNILWVDLRWLATPLRLFMTAAFAVSMLAFAVTPPKATYQRQLTAGLLGFFLVATAWNAATFLALDVRHRITANLLLPASLLILLSLLPVLWVLLRPHPSDRTRPGVIFLTLLAVGFSFPLVQVYCFGKTDYQRHSAAAVVFGARVLRDGRMTTALSDRVARACELYRDGEVQWLVLSGGPGDGPVHETDAMQTYALAHGVPASAIIIDRNGLNTEATVVDSLRLLDQAGVHGRIIAVSEFYHLPRIKLTFEAHGREVYTVPAHPSLRARNFAFRSTLREVPAFWFYFARAVAHNLFT